MHQPRCLRSDHANRASVRRARRSLPARPPRDDPARRRGASGRNRLDPHPPCVDRRHRGAHGLEVAASDPGGGWTELVRRLATQASLSDWAPDVSTLFACRAHLEDPAVMTFAFVALDATGDPADCVVWGQDPGAMIDGTLARVNDPPLPLGRCRVLP